MRQRPHPRTLPVDVLAHHRMPLPSSIYHTSSISSACPWVSGVCIASIVTIRTECSFASPSSTPKMGWTRCVQAPDSRTVPGSFVSVHLHGALLQRQQRSPPISEILGCVCLIRQRMRGARRHNDTISFVDFLLEVAALKDAISINDVENQLPIVERCWYRSDSGLKVAPGKAINIVEDRSRSVGSSGSFLEKISRRMMLPCVRLEGDCNQLLISICRYLQFV